MESPKSEVRDPRKVAPLNPHFSIPVLDPLCPFSQPASVEKQQLQNLISCSGVSLHTGMRCRRLIPNTLALPYCFQHRDQARGRGRFGLGWAGSGAGWDMETARSNTKREDPEEDVWEDCVVSWDDTVVEGLMIGGGPEHAEEAHHRYFMVCSSPSPNRKRPRPRSPSLDFQPGCIARESRPHPSLFSGDRPATPTPRTPSKKNPFIQMATPSTPTRQCSGFNRVTGARCTRKVRWELIAPSEEALRSGRECLCFQHRREADERSPGRDRDSVDPYLEWIDSSLSEATRRRLRAELDKPLSERDDTSGFIYVYKLVEGGEWSYDGSYERTTQTFSSGRQDIRIFIDSVHIHVQNWPHK
ncbi:hypothetical protein HK104_009345 [Borealophlyctis nickersoniae]|nr:hypothetical protein HK104_009345 [Borealophlyctis nickersoniae]